jgi:hypothetical protein
MKAAILAFVGVALFASAFAGMPFALSLSLKCLIK